MSATYIRVSSTYGLTLALLTFDWKGASSNGVLDLGPFTLLALFNFILGLLGAVILTISLRSSLAELVRLRDRFVRPTLEGSFVRVSALRQLGSHGLRKVVSEEAEKQVKTIFVRAGAKCGVVFSFLCIAVYGVFAFAPAPILREALVRRSWLTLVSAAVVAFLECASASALLSEKFLRGQTDL